MKFGKKVCTSLQQVRKQTGMAVSIIGLSLGISTAFAANDEPKVPESSADTTTFSEVDVQPEFPGGEAALMNFIKTNLKYPPSAAKKGIEGRVTLSFIVEKDGSIKVVEALKSPDEALTKEAIRVVKAMPKWNAGKRGDATVRVKYVMPILFRLNASQTENKGQQATRSHTDKDGHLCVEPQFPGGETALKRFIEKNLKYPSSARRKKIEGRVILSYVVEKDGSISSIEVIKSPDDALSEESIRVVKLMPKWTPGTSDGQPVRIKYVLPLTFRLK